MSGHSKWSTIKHKKGIADIKRGKLFSKVAKAITIATKEGQSDDPSSNARLRLAVEQAKAINMPKDSIKKAIDKGVGRGERVELQQVSYEGFGPEKVACVVDCITDNKNRTAQEIKAFFDRGGGSLAGPGSTTYLFEKKGLLLVTRAEDVEAQLLKLIDLGIDDVDEDGELVEVYTKLEQLDEMKKKVEEAGFSIKEASPVLKPVSLIAVKDKDKQDKVIRFLEKLEDHDDVQKVYCNVDIIND